MGMNGYKGTDRRIDAGGRGMDWEYKLVRVWIRVWMNIAGAEIVGRCGSLGVWMGVWI